MSLEKSLYCLFDSIGKESYFLQLLTVAQNIVVINMTHQCFYVFRGWKKQKFFCLILKYHQLQQQSLYSMIADASSSGSYS